MSLILEEASNAKEVIFYHHLPLPEKVKTAQIFYLY